MKTVLVLRHGKSDWAADYGDDHERPLAARGVAAARRIGLFLAAIGEIPDRVVSSTAARARSTADLAQIAGEWKCSVSTSEALYGGSVAETIELVRRQVDSAHRLLLVGHQPTWSELVAALSGGTSVRFPTAALVRIDFDTDRWQEIEPGAGTLRWLVTPKLLKRAGLPR